MASMVRGDTPLLPPDLMDIIVDYLCPTKKMTRANMQAVLRSIELFGEIMLPDDDYSIDEVIHYINRPPPSPHLYRSS